MPDRQGDASARAGGRRYALNFVSLVVFKLAGDFFAFLLFIVLSRVYGQAAIGLFAFATSLSAVLAAAGDFGLYDYTIKELNRPAFDRARFIALLGWLRLILSLVTFAAFAGFALLWSDGAQTLLVLLAIGLHQILTTLAGGIASVLAADEEMALPATVDAAARSGGALLAMALALSGFPLFAALAALTLSALFHLLVMTGLLLRHHRLRLERPQLALTIPILKGSLPYLLSDLARRIGIRIDVIMLGFLAAASIVGTYGAGQRIVSLLLFIPHFAGLALLPGIAKKHALGEPLAEHYEMALRLAILAGIPSAAGVWMVAPDLIHLLFGEEFEPAIAILRFLAPLVLIESVRSLLANYLTGCDLQRDRTAAEWIAVAVAIPAQLVAIHLAGAVGAAAALVLSEAFLAALFLARLVPLLGWPRIGSRLCLGIIAAAAFFVPLELLVDAPLVLALPASMIVYAITLVLFATIRRSEIRLLAELAH